MSAVTIKQLFYYPVKSCAGVEVSEAQVSATGLLHDRRWMVVDANGTFVDFSERGPSSPWLFRVSPTECCRSRRRMFRSSPYRQTPGSRA